MELHDNFGQRFSKITLISLLSTSLPRKPHFDPSKDRRTCQDAPVLNHHHAPLHVIRDPLRFPDSRSPPAPGSQ